VPWLGIVPERDTRKLSLVDPRTTSARQPFRSREIILSAPIILDPNTRSKLMYIGQVLRAGKSIYYLVMVARTNTLHLKFKKNISAAHGIYSSISVCWTVQSCLQASRIMHQASIRHQASSIQHPASSIKHQASSSICIH